MRKCCLNTHTHTLIRQSPGTHKLCPSKLFIQPLSRVLKRVGVIMSHILAFLNHLRKRTRWIEFKFSFYPLEKYASKFSLFCYESIVVQTGILNLIMQICPTLYSILLSSA